MGTVPSSVQITRTPVVHTTGGSVQGRSAEGVHAFLGIPYAAPPFGDRRLRPPQPVEGWSGVRDATRLGPEPPQVAPPATRGPAGGAEEDWGDVAGAFEAVELVLGGVTIVAALRAGSSARAMYSGRVALALLFIVSVR